MLDIRTHLKKALQRTPVPDTVVRLIERARGIRYPGTLIGRLNFPPPPHGGGGVLVFAAHQDDEVLGLGLTLAKHRSIGDRVTVVFTTNGSGGNWKESSAVQRAVSSDPYVSDFECAPTVFGQSEFTSKQEMLAQYASQAISIRYYPFHGEILRKARPIHLLPRLAHFTRLSQGRLRSLTGRPCPSR
jgi:hypothetical protein